MEDYKQALAHSFPSNLKSYGVKCSDAVCIYLPITWHAVAVFLICARIGAIHSIVFSRFSAESLRDRVQDCLCCIVVPTNKGGKGITKKAIVNAALKERPAILDATTRVVCEPQFIESLFD